MRSAAPAAALRRGGALACVLAAVLAAAGPGAGAVEVRRFEDPALESRFRALTYELRCLVCQNQNIADSDAELAEDLRGEVDRMLRAGASDEAVVQFMVDRYGEFVLYRPRLRPATWLLWFGPFLLAGAGLYVLLRQVRRRRAAGPGAALSPEERRRAEALLAAAGDPPPAPRRGDPEP